MSIDTTLTIAEFYAANVIIGHPDRDEVAVLLEGKDGLPVLWVEKHGDEHHVGDDNSTSEADEGARNAAEVAFEWLKCWGNGGDGDAYHVANCFDVFHNGSNYQDAGNGSFSPAIVRGGTRDEIVIAAMAELAGLLKSGEYAEGGGWSLTIEDEDGDEETVIVAIEDGEVVER